MRQSRGQNNVMGGPQDACVSWQARNICTQQHVPPAISHSLPVGRELLALLVVPRQAVDAALHQNQVELAVLRERAMAHGQARGQGGAHSAGGAQGADLPRL